MFCPNCGARNSEADTHCQKCGFNLKDTVGAKFKGTMLMMNDAAGGPGGSASSPPHAGPELGAQQRVPQPGAVGHQRAQQAEARPVNPPQTGDAGSGKAQALSPEAIDIVVLADDPAAVAGFGVASRIESLVMIVIFAVSSSVTPFVGQNYGAGRLERVRKPTIAMISPAR